MAWIWMAPAAGAVLLWAVSLGRILSSTAPYSLPPSPRFPPPLRGDRRGRNVLLVLAHPDDESMYVSSPPLLPFVYALHARCSTKFMWQKNWCGSCIGHILQWGLNCNRVELYNQINLGVYGNMTCRELKMKPCNTFIWCFHIELHNIISGSVAFRLSRFIIHVLLRISCRGGKTQLTLVLEQYPRYRS
jgi:hypothetical protein